MILAGEKDSTRAWTIMCETGCRGFALYTGIGMVAPGYRCIFNTETKRYNPRLIGKLHVAVSLFDTNRGKTPNRGKPPSRASHCGSTPLFLSPDLTVFRLRRFPQLSMILLLLLSARSRNKTGTELCSIFYNHRPIRFHSIRRTARIACAFERIRSYRRFLTARN